MRMAEVIREVRDENHGSSALGWLALILSIVALVIAWLAYNRTGEDLETKIQRQIDQSMNNTESNI